jgi:hypothetical protein
MLTSARRPPLTVSHRGCICTCRPTQPAARVCSPACIGTLRCVCTWWFCRAWVCALRQRRRAGCRISPSRLQMTAPSTLTLTSAHRPPFTPHTCSASPHVDSAANSICVCSRADAHGCHLQGVGLRFEAEATGWLQNQPIALTDDSLNMSKADVSTPDAVHTNSAP